MKVKVMILRCSTAFTAVVVCVMLGLSCQQPKPIRMTSGEFSSKSVGHAHPRQTFIITNFGGVQTGRYIVCKSDVDTHYHVVLSLGTIATIPAGTTTFTGTCEGVRVTPIAGCPCETPFLLVSGVIFENSGSD